MFDRISKKSNRIFIRLFLIADFSHLKQTQIKGDSRYYRPAAWFRLSERQKSDNELGAIRICCRTNRRHRENFVTHSNLSKEKPLALARQMKNGSPIAIKIAQTKKVL